jgi:Tfp pilus assembly pilus retraction ATPase PilT
MQYATDIADALARSASGAIVVVGETGSGKTTRELSIVWLRSHHTHLVS